MGCSVNAQREPGDDPPAHADRNPGRATGGAGVGRSRGADPDDGEERRALE